MLKISIIVPVYNVEKYLRQCLDSILSQTFKNFECICINDGSLDSSLSILKEYSEIDKRIKIISQENKGLSVTRNVGIKQSSGKYITFIDSDDWITNGYLEKLYNVIISTDADIVRASYKFYYQKEDIYQSAKIRAIHKINNINNDLERLYKGYAGAFVWGKLYKTNLLKDNNIYFYEGKSSEDCPFSALAFLYAKNIVFINYELYIYRKQVISITSNNEKLRIDALLNFITFTKELVKRKFCSNEIKKFYIDTFIYKIGNIDKSVSKNKQKKILKPIIEHLIYLQSFIKNTNRINIIKIKVVLFLSKYLNIHIFKIFRVLKNLKI
ncbi:MAG: glycosyltransferase family 2 protein [Endomicrobiaceae bacterium]|nr:glycosyltransferase family 2 protein [Endomicrobiaceae bacterium]